MWKWPWKAEDRPEGGDLRTWKKKTSVHPSVRPDAGVALWVTHAHFLNLHNDSSDEPPRSSSDESRGGTLSSLLITELCTTHTAGLDYCRKSAEVCRKSAEVGRSFSW